MKAIVCLLGIMMFVTSCTSNCQNLENATHIINFGKSEDVSPSEVLSASFVKLETNNDCLIGTVSQAEEFDGIFYLLDAFITKTVYAFDCEGRFISTVGSVGNGPGEYAIPSSFFIDANQRVLCIIDMEQNKLLGYSLDGYRMVFEQKLPFPSSSIRFMEDGNIVCYNQEYKIGEPLYNLIVTDKGFNVKKQMLEQEFVSAYKMGMTRKLYSLNNMISAYTHQAPFLFRVKSDTIVPICEFKFGNYQLPSLDFLKKEGGNNQNYIPALLESSYVNFYEVYENERMICVPYYVNKTMYYGWYDKEQSRIYNYQLDEMYKSLNIGPFSSPIGTTTDGKFISLLRINQLIEMKDEGKIFDKDLTSIIEQSKEDDNPILLLLKGL